MDLPADHECHDSRGNTSMPQRCNVNKVFDRDPKRELRTHSKLAREFYDFAAAGMKWSDTNDQGAVVERTIVCPFVPWCLALKPVASGKKNWFQKSGFHLKRKAELEGKPGVYEVGVSLYETLPAGKSPIVVYVGETDDLRERLIYSYSYDGDSLKDGLRPFLDGGFYVYFRWAPMADEAAAIQKEKEILKEFDYALNKEYNYEARPAEDVGWEYEVKPAGGGPPKLLCVSVLRSIKHLEDLIRKAEKEEQEEAEEKKETQEMKIITEALEGMKLAGDQIPLMQKLLHAITTLPSVVMSENIKQRLRNSAK